MNEYMTQAVAIPRWVTFLLMAPLLIICLLLAFVVVPNQQAILRDSHRQDELIEENYRISKENQELILFNKTQLDQFKAIKP